MIAPLMVSIFTDGLRSVRPGWLEGSLALGVNRWRTTWKIAVRTARPAIVAGTVLAVARAIGEAVMLAMVSGSVGFAPNPADGLIFIYEPSRPLAPTIVKNIDQLELAAGQRDPVRDRRGAALLGRASSRSPAGSRGARCANTGRRLMERHRRDTAGLPPPAAPPPAPPTKARSRAAPPGALRPHRPGDLLGAGLLFCAIAVAIVVYLLHPGDRST